MTYNRHLPAVNDRPGLIFMSSLLSLISILAVYARLYSRRLKKLELWVDDYLAIASLVFVLGLNGIFIAGTVAGAITGHSPVVDDFPVTTPLQHTAERYKYAFQTTEKIAFGLIKLSILFLWKRIFAVAYRYFNTLCWFMIVIVTLWCISFFFATVFQCGTDWYLNWAPIIDFLTECSNTLNMLTVFTTTDVFTDFVIMFMPLPMVWRLNLPLRKRLGVISVFAIGLFTISAGIARMYFYLGTSYNRAANPDFIADFTLFILWSEIEVNVAILVCCMPTFVPALARCRDAILQLSHSARISKGSLASSGSNDQPRREESIELGRNSSSVSLNRDIWMGQQQYGNMGVKTVAHPASISESYDVEMRGNGGIYSQTRIVNSVE